MTKYLHFGVVNPQDQDPDRLPYGVISDGDSFTCWGEPVGSDRIGPDDDPLHVIVDLSVHSGFLATPENVERGRRLLQSLLLPGERLTDYFVVTDAADWSKDVVIVTREGALVGANDDGTATPLEQSTRMF